EDEPAGGAVLEEEVRVVATASERDPEETAGDGGVDRRGPAGGEGRPIEDRLRALSSHAFREPTYGVAARRGARLPTSVAKTHIVVGVALALKGTAAGDRAS